MKNIFRENEVIAIAGDWHGSWRWAEIALPRMRKEHDVRTILHVGDFGFWPGPSGEYFLKQITKLLARNEQHIYVVPGNHEDYPWINSLPVDEATGLIPVNDYITILPRGYRWDWHGRKHLAVAGATSIDYKMRTLGIDWWAEENITLGDVYRAVEGGTADVMFTHDTPALNMVPGLKPGQWDAEELAYAQQSSDMLKLIADKVQPSLLFHGHYHFRYTVSGEFYTEDGAYRTVIHGLDREHKTMNVVYYHPNGSVTEMGY